MVFDYYAKYYNLLYQDKDYNNEVNYIHSLIQQYGQKTAKKILDIGCGTGTHASYMSKLGYYVTGIDLSPEMISHAIGKNIPNANFIIGNAVDFFIEKKIDIITSLFHVLSYQTTNENIEKMISQVTKHLSENGLFIFDFWYGPAVLTERPSIRIKRLEDADVKITRIAEPILKINDNIVDVHYELIIENKHNQQIDTIKEIHPMRYFFLPEIEMFLSKSDIQLVYAREWMTEEIPSEKTWGVCCVGEKR